MNKRQIVSYLETKRNAAENAVRVQYNKLREDYMEQLYGEYGLDLLVDRALPVLMALDGILEDFRTQIPNGEYQYGSLLDRSALQIKNREDLRKDLAYMVPKDNYIIEKSYQAVSKDLRAVRENYEKLIACVKATPKADDAAKMLSEIGFDLSDLDKPAEKKQLPMARPDVDIRFLFIQDLKN